MTVRGRPPARLVLSRPAKILVAFLLVVAGVLYWIGWRAGGEPAVIPEDAVPPGRWNRIPLGPSDRGGEMVSLLSLPYLEGKVEAGDLSGVLIHDPQRAFDGLNLYCSGHAPEAVLMDMQGGVLHRWRMPFTEAFPDLAPNQESAFFRRVALLPGGELLAIFQGKGLIKLDRHSRLLWAEAIPAFNDLWVEADGGILLLVKEPGIIPAIDPEEPVLEDFVVRLEPDGEESWRLSLLDLFRRPPWSELLGAMGDRGDILHSNTITRLDGSAPRPKFGRGNLLVSLREVDVVGVIDPEAARVVWAVTGPWHRQHEPVVLPDGRVLLFDNQGAEGGGARVVAIEPSSGRIAWSWGEAAGEELYSPEGGTVARLDNGNLLITASESGRAVEIDPAGEIVWEFVSPHRAGPDDELVAALWEMLRIERSRVDWLDPKTG